MRQVELYIDNQEIDYNELKSIPASLRKRTDKFLEIVGADGSEIDNVLRSLAIPGTPLNQGIISSLMQQGEIGRGSTRVNVKLMVNGIMLFSGPGILKKGTKRGGAAPAFLLEILGDGLSLWEKLEGVSLNQLTDLGAMTWTLSEILANWNDTDFSIYKAWWCPVVYGTERGTGYFDIKEFRPSIGFMPIVQAIFNSQGYTVVSEFFDTYFFRRHAHLFGVGSKWKIDLDVTDYVFRGSYEDSTSLLIAFSTAHVTLLFDPDYDPQSMYFNNGLPQIDPVQPISPPGPQNVVNDAYVQYLIMPVDGKYKFKVRVNTQDESELKIIVKRATVTVIEKDYVVGDSPEGSPGVTVEFTYLLEQNDEVYMYLYGTVIGGGGTWSRIRHTFVTVNLLDEPFIGADIALSSCLPDKGSKEFLRGITHFFNLVWAVDDVTKRVFSEPRFDYTMIEDGVPVTRRGFYRRDLPVKYYDVDSESVDVEYVSPFGNSLGIGFKDSNDPMEKATLSELQRDSDKKIPPYSADITFHDRGVKAERSPNPYFTTLYQSKPSGTRLREDSFIGVVLPSNYNRGDKLPGTVWTPPGGTEKVEAAPTYESDPKCGIMFPDGLLFEFHYNDTDVLYFSETARAPWITQHKWADQGGLPALSDWDTAPCYSDLIAKDTGRKINGLISTFYPAYISTIKEGQVLSCKINIPLPNIAALSFRYLCDVPFDSNPSVWILLELTNYKALVSDEADARFIKYVTAKKEDMDAVTHDDPPIDPITPDIEPEIP